MNQNKEITEADFKTEIDIAFKMHKGADNFNEFLASQLFALSEKLHAQRIEASGEELPSDEDVENILSELTPQSKGFYIEQRLFGAKWMKQQCSKLLAKKEQEMNTGKESLIESEESHQGLHEIIKDKDTEISKLKEESEDLKENANNWELGYLKLKERAIGFAEWFMVQVQNGVYDECGDNIWMDESENKHTTQQLYAKYEEEKQLK